MGRHVSKAGFHSSLHHFGIIVGGHRLIFARHGSAFPPSLILHSVHELFGSIASRICGRRAVSL